MAEHIGWKPALSAALGKIGETLAVRRVALTSNLVYTIPEGTPSGIVHRVAFTQDDTGGHTVTYGGSPVTVDTTAGAQTEVELWPNGAATRTVVCPGAAGAASPLVQIGSLDLPAAPTAGQSVTALADSNTGIPAGVTWDEGGDPVIAAGSRRIVTLVYDGAGWVGTYSLPLPAAADTTAPTVGPAIVPTEPPDLGWLASYWVDDLALADGDPVAAWGDRGGLYAAAQASAAKQPIFRAADAEFNGAPVLDFTTASSCIVTAGWAADAQPNTIVLVAAAPTPTGNKWIVDGIDASNRNGVLIAPDRKIAMFAGSTVAAGASQLDQAPHLVCAVFNGNSSAAYIDDTGYNTVITPGAQGLAGLTIGARYSSNIDGFMGRIAFIGVLSGALTPQQLTDLNAWTAERYGL